MATWGLHMRIAEKLLVLHDELDETSFLVGNIGPDCGVPNEDWSKFTPDASITHWQLGGKKEIRAEEFLEKHYQISGCQDYHQDQLQDHYRKSFMLGYYAHLLTDIAFSEFLSSKKLEDEAYAPLKNDPKFIWTIKKDWYDLDHKYFRDIPRNIFHRTFKNVKDFPDYLDYLPKGAVQRQVDYITSFYLRPVEDLDRHYIYLNEDEMRTFVEDTVETIRGKHVFSQNRTNKIV